MRILLLPPILILLAMTSCKGRCDSTLPGPEKTKTVFVPSPPQPCLRIPPPKRPAPLCPPTIVDCPHRDVDVAALLDYLTELDRWVQLYAWPICKETP